MLYDKKMKQVGTRISQEDWNSMRKYCEDHNLTNSEFIRLAITKLLEKEEEC